MEASRHREWAARRAFGAVRPVGCRGDGGTRRHSHHLGFTRDGDVAGHGAVKSQISGYLTALDFREGQIVKKGDVLAEVDARPYVAALGQYQGQFEKD
jgi:biotin carboxyl carrier protein